MKNKTELYNQITKHGEQLNAIFNTGIEPVKLCKMLRRLEDKALNDAFDALRDGQSQMALRIIAEELNYRS